MIVIYKNLTSLVKPIELKSNSQGF